MTKHIIKTEAEVPHEIFSDVLITAFDGDHGGSNFWAYVDDVKFAGPEPHEPHNDDGTYVAREWEAVTVREQDSNGDPTGPELTVDTACITLGMQRALDEYPSGTQEREWINLAVFDGDAGMIDANLADSIVQYGLFAKQVYG